MNTNLRKYLIPNQPVVPFPFPSSRRLPAEGAWVLVDGYWRRRLRGGDVSEGKPPKPPQPEKAKVKAKAKKDTDR